MRVARLLHHDPAHGHAHAVFARLDGATAHALRGVPWSAMVETGDSWAWNAGELLCPVVPSKIVCVGRNYAEHAKELGNDVPAEPLLFLKPPSSLLAPGGTVIVPPESSRVEHEAELAVIIGKRARRVSKADAMRYVFGYSCSGDITARDIQRKDVQFTRGKGFDTFCPIGPWIETSLDPSNVAIRCRVNDSLRQDGTTSHMIFDVPTLVSYVSAAMTLEAGDVILTGTPSGVGPLVDGDSLSISIDGIGDLRVVVGAYNS